MMLGPAIAHKQASIDLHNLSVADAKRSVISRLKQLHASGVYDIQIITGRGAHANNSGVRAVLFKSLPSWLEDIEIKALIKNVKVNEGSYIVILHEQPSSVHEADNKADVTLFFNELIKQIGIPEIKKLAKTDSAYQGLLGFLSLQGGGTDLNTSQAMQQLRKAAESGDVLSQLFLAHLHTDGTPGVARQSPDMVLKHLEQAASGEGPHAVEAKFRLGIAYLSGRGANQNDVRAIECLTDAAKSEHPWAQLNLAKIYAAGEIVPKDDKLASYYFLAAAQQGILEAQIAIAERFAKGIGTVQSDSNAFIWREKAAKAGDVESLFYIGDAYETGKGVVKNIDLAYESFRDAAEQGHILARTRAAFILLLDKRSDFADVSIGVIWLKEAAALDNQEALFIMATLHNSGLRHPLIEKNEAMALDCIGKSARLGYAPAQKMIFKEDLDVGIGRKAVNEWMVKLALQGDKEAEAYYTWVLESLGEHGQVQQFKKIILNLQKDTARGQVDSNPKFTVVPAGASKAIDAPSASSRTLTPQYSSSQQLGRTQNCTSTQNVNSLASSVASLSISTHKAVSPATSQKSTKKAKKKKKKK